MITSIMMGMPLFCMALWLLLLTQQPWLPASWRMGAWMLFACAVFNGLLDVAHWASRHAA